MDKPERNRKKIYRVCGTPSRNGCITCKKRHVKCDEQKPKCQRCIKARRTCLGYQSTDSTPTQTPPLVARIVRYAPSPLPEVDPEVTRMLYFFSTFSSKGISGYFSSDFWQRQILQLSLAEPCIRHAVVSIGALHQHFNAGQFGRLVQCDSATYQFALRQHTRAISQLQHSMATSNHQEEITLMACILFTCFDSFMGNYQSALVHLRSGLRILHGVRNSGYSMPNAQMNLFAGLLMRLGVVSVLYLDPRLDRYRSSLWQELQVTIPECLLPSFSAIEEAHEELSAIGAAIVCDRDPSRKILILRSVIKDKHMGRLDRWEQKLKEYLARVDRNTSNIDAIVRGATMLKAFHLMISIEVDASRACEDIYYDIINLCKIVDTGELTYDTPLEVFNFSTDLGITAPLFYTAMKCDNLSLRKKAMKILARAPRKEGMWDAQLCANIVAKVLQVQEPAQEIESCGLKKEFKLRDEINLNGFHPESLLDS
ncbi:hypothetical protein B0J14DRAFT_655372 [Halenospora varia]|nr:hypothetical protein B0J14DRAFT_655372 [Halenospora varia]